MSARLQLLGMDGAALEKLVVDELGESRFRAKQIAQWLARGAETTEGDGGVISAPTDVVDVD